MNQKISYISELDKQLKSLLPMSNENQQRLDKKFMLEFNYNSNHIEGNTLTYNETELVLIFGDTKGEHTLREYEEMQAHNVAYNLIKELVGEKERPLTESFIKNLNQIILVRPYWKDAETPDGKPTKREIKVGYYKEYPNSVRMSNGEMFHYASVTDTPVLMQELIEWYRVEENKKELSPVELAALLHYKFVRIHPFDDGNGRISRLLINYVLLKHGLPPVIIKSTDKNRYLSALHQADVGDQNAFVSYIADQLIWSLDLSIKAARGETIDEPGDLDKRIDRLKKKLKVQSEEKVKIAKSSKIILELLNNSFIPLIQNIQNKLSQFDVLFKDKSIGHIIDTNQLFETNEEVLRNYFGDHHINTFISDYKLSKLKNSNPNNFEIEERLLITFHDLIFEIELVGYNEKYTKYYHEKLSEEEIEKISETFGIQAANKIENFLDFKNTK